MSTLQFSKIFEYEFNNTKNMHALLHNRTVLYGLPSAAVLMAIKEKKSNIVLSVLSITVSSSLVVLDSVAPDCPIRAAHLTSRAPFDDPFS